MNLINRSKVKAHALECAKSRAHKFTRVSKLFLDEVEAHVRVHVANKVQALPSKGKTL